MFNVRGEGDPVKFGFNFYPWSERKHSVGFVFRYGTKAFVVRYAHTAKRIYVGRFGGKVFKSAGLFVLCSGTKDIK